ncbi:hypothetical protein [Dysgonomonas sp. HGC4]|uniref:hypothetical protein n=1 Tax=Dysgonomonas sp. HGC4 TaxID=1658009 RepID=UPI000A51D288|nr:hypothetical protein [Dysgonomonas sp. HGC4]MBD8346883.1 hypothetical protein [Dysgonomonas sp. HGC4]
MKTIYIKLSLLLLAFCMTVGVSGQSIRNDEGKELARMLTDNSFEMVHAGVVSYKLENGKFIMLFNNIPHELGSVGSYERSDSKIQYYNKEGDMIGYYVLGEGRFYRVTANVRRVVKEETAATILDGILLRNDGEGATTKFTVDNNFDPTVIGFILFYIIG